METRAHATVESLQQQVDSAEDRLRAAVILSARSNVFDDECCTKREIRDALGHEDDLSVSDLDLFRKDLASAQQLLFCHDSAPELLYDKILMQEIQREFPEVKIVSVVRAQRVLFDAMQEDAEAYGIDKVAAAIVDPGVPALGIPLNESSREFRDLYEQSDLILGKGQAHFETLNDGSKTSYFLMRVKCEVVARVQGADVGSLILVKA